MVTASVLFFYVVVSGPFFGWSELGPYPTLEACQAQIRMGSWSWLSQDAMGYAYVGDTSTCYTKEVPLWEQPVSTPAIERTP